NASVYTATSTGSYQVQITQAGANAWSALVNVQVLTCSVPPPSDSTESVSTDPETEDPDRIMSAESKTDSAGFQMKVFPNPTSGLFTIVLNMASAGQEKVSIKIVNLLGQPVYTKEISGNNQEIKETVELDQSLATGFYTLQVTIGSKVENTTVVLSR
ncbi:MAG: T9SS type A sorting domain-containing protein, partial [Bacteroidota bacterium]|nr:T9SS type A sorting domain-containing protein [Bacteroidota bacterium]